MMSTIKEHTKNTLRRMLLLSTILVFLLTMPACAANAPTYGDVPSGAWYAGAVQALREKNLMDGVGDNRFGPDGVFTRAQLTAVLYRMAGSPAVSGEDSFADTDPGQWYSDAVLWASQNGVVNGYGNGLFGTNDAATQEQMAVMLRRSAGSSIPDPEYAAVDSAENPADSWAADAVRWAHANGLLTDVVVRIDYEVRRGAVLFYSFAV